MPTIHKNAGLKMAMESAIGTAKTITAATNAAPGVFTSVAHGYLDGDVILLKTMGMNEVNFRVFVVTAKATDTFQLEDPAGTGSISTSAYGVFTSGTAEKLTLGTTLSGVQDFSAEGGDIKFVDITTVHDLNDMQDVVGSSAMSYKLTMQWDPADSAQMAMRTAFETQAAKGFKFTWPNGRFMLFYGSVGYSGMPGGGKQGVTTAAAAISMKGAPTFGTN